MKNIIAPLLWGLTACVVKKENPIDTTAAGTTTTSTDVRTDTVILPNTPPTTAGGATSSATTPAATTPPTGGAALQATHASWVVFPGALGPLHAGMMVAEASNAVGGGFSSPGTDGSCTYARWANAPSGVAVMLENNKVARIEVRSGSTATSTGARIGDTEARIKSLYPGRVTVSPHKYVATGHYLTVTPAGGTSDQIIFETDGKVVTNYRTGELPAVGYVERCG
jgi:hypothetical protein